MSGLPTPFAPDDFSASTQAEDVYRALDGLAPPSWRCEGCGFDREDFLCCERCGAAYCADCGAVLKMRDAAPLCWPCEQQAKGD